MLIENTEKKETLLRLFKPLCVFLTGYCILCSVPNSTTSHNLVSFNSNVSKKRRKKKSRKNMCGNIRGPGTDLGAWLIAVGVRGMKIRRERRVQVLDLDGLLSARPVRLNLRLLAKITSPLE